MKTKFLIILVIIQSAIFSNAQLPADGWSFSYPTDKFTDNALLDLRYLNEKTAGENGFIQLSSDGNSFQTENGEPIRFWSINGGDGTKDMSDADLAKFARFLAKMGVNMIRYHGSINPTGSNINDVDKADVSAIWRMVAAMKKEGIYSTISPFWAHNGHMGNPAIKDWGIPGYSNSDDLWGVMYFSDTLKNAYKNWVKYLYTETNPFTGVALKDDPAVALIQVKNEDGLFWWTISSVKPEFEKIIMKKFYEWAIAKYGSDAAVKSAWSNASQSKDNWAAGELALYNIWDATQPQSGGKSKRVSDQIQFLTETERNFYQEIHDYYRDSLHCPQLINANNWKTADANLLFDAERYANSSCEVLAVNRYFDPGHIGPNAGWRIDPGDNYVGNSVLFEPNKLPVNIKQVKGHPMLVTESGWNLPHKYQAEGPFLVSAFMSLTGVDSYYWFSPTSSAFDSNPYFTWANLPGGQHPMYRWTISTPGQLAMFPANALLYRKGYITQGETVVHEERKLQSMYDRKMPLISEENSFDPNRDSYDRINPAKETVVSPLAHLTGKVEVVYEGNSDSSKVSPQIEDLIDYQNKRIKAGTNQLKWDYKNGICIMDAPSVQGVCGFTNTENTFELSDVTIETSNEYASIQLVAMDDKSIGNSSKILIQVGTVYQPPGWKESATEFDMSGTKISGFKIENTGRMPWKCANTQVTLKIKNEVVNSALLLDAAGYPVSTIDMVQIGNELQITLPENAMYVMLVNTTHSNNIDLKEKGMKLFPNPSNGNFRVEIQNYKPSAYSMELLGLGGEKFLEIKNIQQSSFHVNTNKLAKGIFLAVLKNEKGVVETEKIFIQNN
ncbi:MAG: T9SS type A sorting domain-containing protein [Draconibacterium sp.]|nr:T9SS type A sorting domain-containing protein [Draconibacterium sp.]